MNQPARVLIAVILTTDWVWPQGTAWVVMVSVEMHTPQAWGGYRTPVQDRDVRNNRASAVFGSWWRTSERASEP
jgi:hypothetical protein